MKMQRLLSYVRRAVDDISCWKIRTKLLLAYRAEKIRLLCSAP